MSRNFVLFLTFFLDMKAGKYLINKDAMRNAGRKLCPQSKFFKQLVVQTDHGDAKEPVDFVFEVWFKKFLFSPCINKGCTEKYLHC